MESGIGQRGWNGEFQNKRHILCPGEAYSLDGETDINQT